MDVKAARRTMEVFETFAQEQRPLSLTDIVNALGSPMSTCLYLVRTLERLGYLYPVGGKRTIYPTRKLYEVATAIAASEPWIARIEPRLKALRDNSRETVILGKRQDRQVVYLAVYEGPETIRYVARVGDLKPLHSSAIGKALLAAMDEKCLARLLGKISLSSITPSTLTDEASLLENLKQARDRGYTVSRAENVPDVMAVARTLELDGNVYGIALAGPLHRMEEAFEEQSERLRIACEAITGS